LKTVASISIFAEIASPACSVVRAKAFKLVLSEETPVKSDVAKFVVTPSGAATTPAASIAWVAAVDAVGSSPIGADLRNCAGWVPFVVTTW
jgi:hypothetical protein